MRFRILGHETGLPASGDRSGGGFQTGLPGHPRLSLQDVGGASEDLRGPLEPLGVHQKHKQSVRRLAVPRRDADPLPIRLAVR